MLTKNLKKENTNDLTKSQLALWTGQQLNSCLPLYNMAFTFDFAGEINVECFQKAFQILINKSDAMRTVFYLENDIPQRRVLEKFTYISEFLDWSNEDYPDEKLENWVSKKIKQNFDLSEILFESVLIKLSDKHYIWFINQHHLITDGWSISIQFKKFAEIYTRLANGKSGDDIKLPQFQKYLDYEKTSVQNLYESTIENHWNEKLKAIPKTPKLYGQINEENITSTTRTSIEIGVERAEKLRNLVENKNFRLLSPQLTLFNIFVTILYAYLYRVCGEEKIVIGTPSHNRVTKDFKNTIGVFIEFYPFLAEVEKNDTFLSLFDRLKNRTYEFLKNAKTGSSHPSVGKSFNVILNYFTASFADFNEIKCQATWHHSGHFDANNHLGLEVFDFEDNGNLKLNFDINNAVIPKIKQNDAIGHFIKIFDAFLDNYHLPINEVEIVSETEQKRVFEFGNANKKAVIETQTILDVFQKQVVTSPNKIVVQYGEKTLSFKELDEKSNQLANHLLKLGVETESKVALFLERSTNLLVGIYGILKAGGVYVPLDEMYPKERLKFILDDADISVVVSQEALKEKLPINDCNIVKLDGDSQTIFSESKDKPNVQIEATNLAYIIYTSGSTGTPKGAMNEHGSVIQLLEKITDDVYFQYQGSLNLSLVAPCVFDASVLPIFASTLLGYKLIIAPENVRFDGKALSEFYKKYEIDITDVTPAHLRLLLKSAKHLQVPKHFIIGGEALSSSLLSDFHNKFNANEYIISNIYGVAECCVDTTGYDIKSGEKVNYSYVPIGKPFLHDRIYILNEANQIQPIGTSGEICIGGTTVGRGYLNLEDFSKKKFIQNPFIPEERLFKTGDLGFFLPDGNIQYVGRKDNQVNLNGNRIELGEIESRLLAFGTNQDQKIKDVVVSVKKNCDENEFLCAYFVANNELKFSALRKHLSQFLPSYMIPNRFVQMEKLPLTTNGKIDKKSLPFPEVNLSKFEDRYVAPQTEIEETVTDIWSEVLQINKIGIYDDFLELGGNSLAAIRVMTRLNDRVELDLPLNLVFEKPTISQLSQKIEITILKLLNELEA